MRCMFFVTDKTCMCAISERSTIVPFFSLFAGLSVEAPYLLHAFRNKLSLISFFSNTKALLFI